jgi:hypothetical protein
MDEGRDHPATAGSGPPIAGELSPVQRAYGRYAAHFLRCQNCRDIDRSCMEGGRLWRDYESTSEAIGRQMSGVTRAEGAGHPEALPGPGRAEAGPRTAGL